MNNTDMIKTEVEEVDKERDNQPAQTSKRGAGPKEEILGVDFVDMTPDYTKTFEENKIIWAKRYKDVYGEWPPWMPGDETDEQ